MCIVTQSQAESGCDWESESDDDSVYIPTPDCARLLNGIRPPGCKGNLLSIGVKCQGLGGAVSVSSCCNAVFTTHDNGNVPSVPGLLMQCTTEH